VFTSQGSLVRIQYRPPFNSLEMSALRRVGPYGVGCDFAMLVRLSRLASNRSEADGSSQMALGDAWVLTPRSFATVAPNTATSATASTPAMNCCRTLMVAESEAASIKFGFKSLPKNVFTAQEALALRSQAFWRIASRLQEPPPAKTRYRKMKQNRMAASPPFVTGKMLSTLWCAIQ
jgi:hypothetical protein